MSSLVFIRLIVYCFVFFSFFFNHNEDSNATRQEFVR